MMNIRYRPFPEENDSILFDLELFKIDVFRKNLFGDEREEMIVQLRQSFTLGPADRLPRHSYWSVFILEQKKEVWQKVPGSISPYENADTRQYQQPSFSFRFQSIKSEETFNLISSETHHHNLREEMTKTIWEAGESGIYKVMSWTSYVSNSRGDFRDDWHQKSTATFSLDGWPKQLTVKSKRTSHHNMNFELNDGDILDTLSGHRVRQKTTTLYQFAITRKGLALENKDTKTKTQTVYFRKNED